MTIRPAEAQNCKTKRKYGLAIFLLALATLALTPTAQALNHYYAYNLLTDENVTRYSGSIPGSIFGGVVRPDPISADGADVHTSISTYRPAPGYILLSRATGGTTTTMSHRHYSDVSQKCHWYWPYHPGSIGELELTCYARK
ncbi:hypothetical protein ATL40_2882 [Serinibacter salmoneus]|uniref:Uncharacterized protein n=1 Tax=Serinibacter salmoneus TaxID=556530 RepID=A0A2A9D5Y7_9MICO|nr:hypothetical protein ATL40_2882 [Serinibacter salmoneus]